MESKLIGFVQIFVVVSLWAITSSYIVRLIQQPPEVILSIACLAALLFFLGKLKIQNKISELKVQKKHLFTLIFGVGVAQGINIFLFWMAIKSTTIASANFSHYFAPVIVALALGPLILREPIKLPAVIASIGGLSGLGFVIFSTCSLSLNPGIIFGLTSAFFFAILIVSERKLALTGKITPEVDTVFKVGIPALIFLPIAAVYLVKTGISFSLYDLGLIVLLGLIQQGLCNFLLFKGLQKVPARHAAYIFYGEPLIASLLIAPFLLKESLSLLAIVGGCLIVGSGILITRYSPSLSEKLDTIKRKFTEVEFNMTMISILMGIFFMFSGVIILNNLYLTLLGFGLFLYPCLDSLHRQRYSIFTKVSLLVVSACSYLCLFGFLTSLMKTRTYLDSFISNVYSSQIFSSSIGNVAIVLCFLGPMLIIFCVAVLLPEKSNDAKEEDRQF